MKPKIVYLFVFILIIITMNNVEADKLKDLQNKLQNVNDDIKETKTILNNIKNKKKGIIYEKEVIEKEINTAENELEEINKFLQLNEQKIQKKQQELLRAVEKADKHYDLLKKRMTVMYEEGTVSYLEIIMNSASFTDFISRVEIIKNIIQYDKVLFDKLEKNKNMQYKLKRELQAEKVKREKLKENITLKKSELKDKKESRASLINELSSKQQRYEQALNDLEDTSQQVAKELKRVQEENMRKYAGGKLIWPCPGNYRITSYYGYRLHPITGRKRMHHGIDIAADTGDNVVAANSGVVVYADWNGGYGKCVIIDHGGGIATLYAHNSSILVKPNQEVKRGDVICKIGSTGLSTGPHLHFEVRKNGNTINPMNYYDN